MCFTKSSESDKSALENEQRLAEENFNRIISDFKSQLGNDSQITSLIMKGRVYQEIVDLAAELPNCCNHRVNARGLWFSGTIHRQQCLSYHFCYRKTCYYPSEKLLSRRHH